MRLTKWPGNPILRARPGSPWEKMAVLNPGAWYDNGTVKLLYRAAGEDIDYRIYLGLAESRDGFHFERTGTEPVLAPSVEGWDAGCIEDPRIVKFGDEYIVAYAARAHPPHAHWGGRKRENLPAQTPTWTENWTRSGLASSKDLRHFDRLGPCTPDDVDNRDVMLFPEKIAGRYVMLHRALDRTEKKYPQCKTPAIWIAYSDDLKTWTGDQCIARSEQPWEALRIGAGAPPIRTAAGWLDIYHAVGDIDGKGQAYRAGVMLHDLEDPARIIARAPDFIMEPEERFELEGAVNRVVFPCGNVVIGDTLFVYYGAADSVCCVATCKLQDLVDYCLRYKR